MSDELFREVDEDVKRDQWFALWNKYGWYLVGLIVLVIGATGAITGWQTWRMNQQLAVSANFVAAGQLATADNIEQAISALDEIVTETEGGYRMIAQFRQAALMSDSGAAQDATELYLLIADDESYADYYRNLATLLMAANSLGGDGIVGDADNIRSRLSAIAVEGNPFRHSARELSAALAIARGDIEDARNHFKLLSDSPDTPPSMRVRATELLRAVE